MSIMQQSSRAQDRDLDEWYVNIKNGYIMLPRFQRGEAWDHKRVQSFLNTIINNLPVGVTLSLEVAPGKEKFPSNYIETAKPERPGENTVNQHLLDGQQRLTSFWRSMHNNYIKETYFISIPGMDYKKTIKDLDVEVHCQGRWFKKDGSKMPRWADDPKRCLKRKLIPIHLLQPGDIGIEVDEWIKAATVHLKPKEDEPGAFGKLELHTDITNNIKGIIVALRERIARFNLPFLSLPIHTPEDVALQVYINMNTNSKPLSIYDIIVAELEMDTRESLHDLKGKLVCAYPKVKRYGNINSMILSTSALLQEKLPNHKGMGEMDMEIFLANWPKLEKGLDRMCNLLESQAIFDQSRLPTNAVLAVIAALYELVPDDGDFRAKAEKLLRSYMWSAFFTDRYENSSASRAYADFRALKKLLKNQKFDENNKESVPVFNEVEFPIASVEQIIETGWPKKVGIVSRGILAVANFFGGEDFADEQIANYDSIQKREYHHLFPDKLLENLGVKSSLALNCALITWKTNRVIGRKDPLDYLKDRIDWASESAIKQRLRTHLVPWDELVIASYDDYDSPGAKDQIENDYDKFLNARAKLIDIAIVELTKGEKVSLDFVWSEYEKGILP